MVQLFLDGTEIFPDASMSIKVTKENPYFTLSDSYTLDVSVPLDIYENKVFFGHLERTEKKKEYREYDAKLVVGNKTILHGQARMTQSTNKEVKLQLTTGVSALKMTAANDNTYIDEMDLYKFSSLNIYQKDLDAGFFDNFNYTPDTDYGFILGDAYIKAWGIPLKDCTNEVYANLADGVGFSLFQDTTTCQYYSPCPRLVDVAKAIADKLGYKLDTSCLPEACNYLYIITGEMTRSIAKKLPHWTVAEFFEQFQNFFGCTIEDSGDRNLRLCPLDEYASKPVVEIDPAEEYEIDYTEEDETKGIINNNLEYGMNGSDTEIVDDDILEKATKRLYMNNYAEAYNHFYSSNKDERMSYLYDVKGELNVGWNISEDACMLRRIAPFNPLVRYKDAGSTKLKISPVHISENEECKYFWPGQGYKTISLHLPEVANTQGLKRPFGFYSEEGSSEIYNMQDLIEGNETLVSNDDKDDVMPVAFFDSSQAYTVLDGLQAKIRLAYTDARYKPQYDDNRRQWSLSLNKVQDFEFYLGQMHELSFQCSRKCKMKISFYSESIPDPKSIFIIRNKRYACEKIEADIKDGEMGKLMIGYFYEMTM